MQTDYKVELDVYCGPLDLLLHLVKREELVIEKIPVARVADQFIRYLENLAHIDIEIAGDFLVMAARLTEMKSRALLPQITTEDEELDEDLLADETDLISRLLEYRVFKDISRKLRNSAEVRALRFGRAMFPEVLQEEPVEEEDLLAGLSIMDVFSAFQRLARGVLLEEARTIFYDDVPIERHIERVLERLSTGGTFAFSHIIPKGVRKAYIIGAFIALLELVKQKKISLQQETDFQEITVGEHTEPPPLPEEDEAPAASGATSPPGGLPEAEPGQAPRETYPETAGGEELPSAEETLEEAPPAVEGPPSAEACAEEAGEEFDPAEAALEAEPVDSGDTTALFEPGTASLEEEPAAPAAGEEDPAGPEAGTAGDPESPGDSSEET